MSTIILEIDNPKTELLICNLAEELHIPYTVEVSQQVNFQTLDDRLKFIDKMNALAEQIGKGSISDPQAWQKEQRTDRTQPFRDDQ